MTVHVSDDYVKPADTIAPAVRVALAGTAGNDGWLVTSPIALITASDNAAAPIAELELAVGDGAWVTVGTNVNTAVQAVTGEGIVSVRARATDAAGNVSEIAAAEARVDATAPTVTASVDTVSRTMTLTASDGAGSGVKTVEYRVGNGEWQQYEEGAAITASSSKRETVSYRASDIAGNMSAAGVKDIPSDTSRRWPAISSKMPLPLTWTKKRLLGQLVLPRLTTAKPFRAIARLITPAFGVRGRIPVK